MSGTAETFSYTKEDVRKLESRESKLHGGNIPAGSAAAQMQSVVDKAEKSKADVIAERQANLPLPEQPPVASDFNSADGSITNVGSGAREDAMSHGEDSLRGPATGGSAARTDGTTLGQGVGREGKDGLSGLPNDAVTREARNKTGTVEARGEDKGYPQKSDPSTGL